MGISTYVCFVSAFILILYFRPAYAINICHRNITSSVQVYVCPDDKHCCETERSGCCQDNNDAEVVNAFIIVLVVIAVCLLCSCCIRRQKNQLRRQGAVHGRVGVVTVNLPPHTLPQVYPAQSPYPPPAAYNPYYGVPPPEYQPSAPNPVENPHVLLQPQAVPAGWTLAAANYPNSQTTAAINNYS